nr:helix-turn-helix domain-containing protein [candidate division Zixibacteria bacterium]
VGGITSIHVDVRIICATNRNLEQAIHDKEFRDDLFYRLNEITLFLPPLRERPEDIPLLVRHFIDKYNQLYSKDFRELSPSTIDRLMTFSWPGNVRQLENMLKQVAVRGDESIIIDLINSAAAAPTMPSRSTYTPATTDVGPTNAAGTETYSLKERIGRTVAEEEKRLISEVLTRTNWNRRKAADLLEISYRSLLYKIKDYNLNSSK